jgi:hypothetical protein
MADRKGRTSLFSTSSRELGLLTGFGNYGTILPVQLDGLVFIERRLHLGGELPSSVILQCPRLNTGLRIDIPSGDLTTHQQAYAVFKPVNTLSLCKQVLHEVGDYDAVIGKALEDGASLQLAWRMDARLDWIWQPEDVLGKYREWVVLYGLAIRQVRIGALLVDIVTFLFSLIGGQASPSRVTSGGTPPYAHTPQRWHSFGRTSGCRRLPGPHSAELSAQAQCVHVNTRRLHLFHKHSSGLPSPAAGPASRCFGPRRAATLRSAAWYETDIGCKRDVGPSQHRHGAESVPDHPASYRGGRVSRSTRVGRHTTVLGGGRAF